MATVIIHTADQYLAGFLAELQTLSSYPELAISIAPDAENGVNAKPVTNGQALPKLSHEELMAMPLEQRIAYYEAHGGVYAIMLENGFCETEAQIIAWEEQKAEHDAYLDSLPWDQVIALINGK
jgi:hypothetical protein